MNDDSGLIGQIKQKLIDTKQKWAREGRSLTGDIGAPGQDRLPPGQREVKNFPVLDLGVQPRIDTQDWTLTVDGLVEQPLKLDWKAYLALPRMQFLNDIHCVTTWSRYDNRWEGVAARTLLAQVKPKANARFVIFHAYDGYTTNVPLAEFDDDDVLLADRWEGEALTREHGGPLRVVIPKLYFWKSAKWVKRIELTEDDRPGFWEVRGYHNHGDPWTEERYG